MQKVNKEFFVMYGCMIVLQLLVLWFKVGGIPWALLIFLMIFVAIVHILTAIYGLLLLILNRKAPSEERIGFSASLTLYLFLLALMSIPYLLIGMEGLREIIVVLTNIIAPTNYG